MLRLIVDLNPIDPALGLALEEALFAGIGDGTDDILRIWVNKRSVIIGRSQSARSEVDLAHLRDLSIPVRRRISGGGAVYHYPGNLNLSLFLRDGRHLGTVSGAYTAIGGMIVSALSEIGIDANVEGNTLLIGEKKIAGAAQARRGSILLYHTTLLVFPSHVPIDSVLLAMHRSYKPDFVASHPRSVACLSQITSGIRLEILTRTLNEELADGMDQELREGSYTEEELKCAKRLQIDKYESDEWNLSR